MTQHTNSRYNYAIGREYTQVREQTQQNAQPSIYNADGKIDITARRNAIIARMKETNTVQQIWDSRMGC